MLRKHVSEKTYINKMLLKIFAELPKMLGGVTQMLSGVTKNNSGEQKTGNWLYQNVRRHKKMTYITKISFIVLYLVKETVHNIKKNSLFSYIKAIFNLFLNNGLRNIFYKCLLFDFNLNY